MATRYVWEKYKETLQAGWHNTGNGISTVENSTYTYSVSSEYKFSKNSNGKIKIIPSGKIKYFTHGVFETIPSNQSTFNYYYGIIQKNDSEDDLMVSPVPSLPGTISFSYVIASDSSTGKTYSSISVITTSPAQITASVFNPTTQKTEQTYVSSSNRNEYTNGVSGEYTYTYLGADSIDPISITYPNSNIYNGSIINIRIEKSNSNIYSGIISYIYQYSENSGSNWITIQTTSSSQINYTISSSTTKIKFRVNAKDNYGFTSSTYIIGPDVTISSKPDIPTSPPSSKKPFYVGVNGLARTVNKFYVGVNGTARKVKKAYIGIDNIARLFYESTPEVGTVWELSPYTLPYSTYWNDVIYANGKFVAISSNGIAYSYDGLSWNTANNPVSNTNWRKIAYGNGKFVIISDGNYISGSSKVAYSTDGINWATSQLPTGSNWKGIAYGNGKFVAVGHKGNQEGSACAYSTDGINWTTPSYFPKYVYYDIAYGNGIFFACGCDYDSARGIGMYSTDGIDWTSITLPGSYAYHCITYGNGRFVSKSIRNHITYSSNGKTWSSQIAMGGLEYMDITYAKGKFILVIYGKIYCSDSTGSWPSDGSNWISVYNQSGTYWGAVTYGANKFIAVSTYGNNQVVYSEKGNA